MNTTRFLRHLNTRRCLRLLADGRARSRAEMARELGLTRSTVGNAVKALDEAGYIVNGESTLPEGGTGRPGITVSLRPQGACFIGVNISLRTLSAVALDLCGNIIRRKDTPVVDCCHQPGQVFEKLIALCNGLVAELDVPKNSIEGIGVAVPGLVDRTGTVVNAPFLQWYDYPLRKHLLRHYRKWQVVVCNDAFAFGNMETCKHPPTVEHDTVLYVLMNEGIGSVLFAGGRPLLGAHGHAGEIGHMQIVANTRSETFESMAGAVSLTGVFPPQCTPSEGIAHLLAAKQQPPVIKALDRWAQALALGLGNAIHLFDPARIVLGGPIALLYPEVKTQVTQWLEDTLLRGLSVPEICVAQRSEDAAAIGAAETIRQALFALPDLEADHTKTTQ